MASDCIFCQIVAGEAEASVAYQDEVTLAFMDLRQMQAGHTLVIPKRHVRDIYELDDGTGAALMSTTARVARAVRAAFASPGINVWQSNGAAAGQEVFHVHFHVLPRQDNDGLLKFEPASSDLPSRSALDERAALIRAALDG